MSCFALIPASFKTDTNRMRMDGNHYFLRSPDEMYAKFPNLEDAVARSQEIADSVDIELELGARHFPFLTYRNPRPPKLNCEAFVWRD